MKLNKVERTVNIYNSKTDDIIEEIGIDIPLEDLKQVVIAKEDDPLLYDGYVLDENQIKGLNRHLTTKIIPDFNINYYVLECYGIYDEKE